MAMERAACAQQVFEGGLVQCRTAALPDDRLVRFPPERTPRVQLPTSGAEDFTRRIKILHAYQPRPAGMPRQQPASERRQQGTKMQIAGRRRRETAAVARWRGRKCHKGSSGKGPEGDFT